MNEFEGVILLAALAFGFAPVAIIIVYCLLTGRTGALFLQKDNEPLASSPFVRNTMRLYLLTLPVYVVLLCLYAFLDLN